MTGPRREVEHDQDDDGDAPPDVGLLAEFSEAVENGRPPSQAALEEAAALVDGWPGVAGERLRQRALNLWDELWATGEYSSRCALDERVARTFGVRPATVRTWRFRARKN